MQEKQEKYFHTDFENWLAKSFLRGLAASAAGIIILLTPIWIGIIVEAMS